MKHFFTLIALLLITNLGFAQISIDISPQSVKDEILAENIGDLPIHELPKFQIEKILAEDANTVNSNRYAAPLVVNYTLNNSGKWINLLNGDGVWVLKVKGQDALSMQALYNRFKLPEGATLHIYNETKMIVLGAFTSFNNKEGGKFATAVIISRQR